MNCCRCPHSLASESSRRSRNPTVLLVGATSQMTMQHKYTDAGPRESATAETQRAREHATTTEANSPGSGLDILPRQETDRRRPEAVVVRGNLTRLPLAPKARFKSTQYPFGLLSNLLKSRHLAYERGDSLLAFFLLLGLILLVQSLWAQDRSPSLAPAVSSESAETASPDMQNPRQILPPEQTGTSSIGSPTKQSDAKSAARTMVPANQGPPEKQQPKRILGLMPNFRAVSAGAIPPPQTPKEAFIIATRNSFDYSSFIFVGITSFMAEGTSAHRQLGKGVAGFERYYWRGFVDKTDGNYLAIFALPTVFHQDERYYAMGTGSIWKRGFYSASRVVITPDYHGHNSFNISELLGKGMAQGISVTYYPSGARTAGSLATKYGYAIGRDALTNVFREFWPDIAVHVLHRHP